MLSEEHLYKLMTMGAPHRFVIGDDPSKVHDTDENRIAKSVKILANLIKKVVDTEDKLFSLKAKRKASEHIQTTHTGGRLATAIAKQLPQLEEYFPDHAYNRYIELLRKQVRKRPELEAIKPHLKLVRGAQAIEVWSQLDALVNELREDGRSSKFKAELDARRRQCEKNQQSAVAYIDAIFKYRASKNVVIRIDLANGSETSDRRGITMSVDAEQARRELDKFLRYVREHYPLTGYLGTFEYGLMTGYHFHLLIFIDGHQAFRASALAKRFGEYWKNVITEGRGRYFNCNAAWYQEKGIGMVWHDDYFKRHLLLSVVLPYLTKMDFWLKFEGTKKTFFKGLMPEEVMRPGRPRRTRARSSWWLRQRVMKGDVCDQKSDDQ